MAVTKAQAEAAAKLRTNEKKWTPELMNVGWTVIPSIIIERQRALGLDAIDMNLILHLAQYWWEADNLPHPSVKKIADALGVSVRTVQKRMAGLEAAKLMKRVERRQTKNGSATNYYSFEGLIEAAKPFAAEKAEEIRTQTAAKAERLARKKPKGPTLVVSNPP
ncbi:MAG: helix-turn-helix domain-containing protein [Bauldia sp.]|jgi:DNA-binding transcriptional MocR family regulator